MHKRPTMIRYATYAYNFETPEAKPYFLARYDADSAIRCANALFLGL